MKYPTMGTTRGYRVSVPQLNGGLNVSVPPHMIDDNQLSDVKNMWYKDGRLQTRPGMEYRGTLPLHENPDETTVIPMGEYSMAYSFISAQGIVMQVVLFDGKGNVVDSCAEQLPVEGTEVVSVFSALSGCDASEDLSKYKAVFFVTTNYAEVVPFGLADGKLTKLKPYVPTILKGGKPHLAGNAGVEGSQLEPMNMLTREYVCEYITDGEGSHFLVPKPLDYDQYQYQLEYTGNDGVVHTATANTLFQPQGGAAYIYGELGTEGYFVVRQSTNQFWIQSVSPEADGIAPEVKKLSTIGTNIIFRATVPNVSTMFDNAQAPLRKLRFSTWFGGGSSGLSGGTRLFVAGNPDYPNRVQWSALNNPLYFPENNYAYVGDNANSITAFGKQGELLVIFKEREIYCTQYVQGSAPTAEQLEAQTVIDVEAAQAMFPMFPIHPEIGCDCPDTVCLCNNRLVWLNGDGNLYGLFSTGTFNERNVRVLSKTVRPLLKQHTAETLKAATAAEFENNYLLMVGDTVYVMDYSSSGFTYYSSYSNDEKAQKAVTFYLWDTAAVGGIKRLLTVGGNHLLMALNEDQVPVISAFSVNARTDSIDKDGAAVLVPCFFKTKLFDFGYPERLKRVNSFYLQVGGEEGKSVNLTYFRGNGNYPDSYMPVLTGESLENCQPIRITPNAVRVRNFGFEISCDGFMEIGSLLFNYSIMGTVR